MSVFVTPIAHLGLGSSRTGLVTPKALRRNASFELGHAAEPGNVEIRGNICQRIQNEVALHYPGMRESELRVVEPFAPVDEHVEIDNAGAPALALLRPASSGLEGAQPGGPTLFADLPLTAPKRRKA